MPEDPQLLTDEIEGGRRDQGDCLSQQELEFKLGDQEREQRGVDQQRVRAPGMRLPVRLADLVVLPVATPEASRHEAPVTAGEEEAQRSHEVAASGLAIADRHKLPALSS